MSVQLVLCMKYLVFKYIYSSIHRLCVSIRPLLMVKQSQLQLRTVFCLYFAQ